MTRIIRNAIMTPDGTILESRDRHDFQTYLDENGNEYMVDGGLDYLRRNIHPDYIDVSLYDDQPHEVQREVLKWGTYGKDGKQPFQCKPISLMDTGHIEACLREYPGMSSVHRACMQRELVFRKPKEVPKDAAN